MAGFGADEFDAAQYVFLHGLAAFGQQRGFDPPAIGDQRSREQQPRCTEGIGRAEGIENAAKRRPHDLCRHEGRRSDRDRAAKRIAVHELGNDRLVGRHHEGARAAEDDQHGIDRHDVAIAGDRHQDQRQRTQHLDRDRGA